MRVLAGAVAAVVAIAAFFLAGEAAHAHAALVSSEPADGAMVASSPSRFTLIFNEPVVPLVLRLVSAGGSTVLGNPSGRQATLLVAPLPQMPNGTHVLSWRVVSLDGHPVGGSIVFSIGAPSAGPLPDTENATTPAVAAVLWVAKIAVYIGLFIGVGGSCFGAWIGPRTMSARRPIVAALAIGLVASPLSVGVQGLDALDLSLAGLGEKIAWVAGFETSYGLTAVAAGFSLFAGLSSLAVGSARVAGALSMSGLLGVGVALALSGHASAAEPQWLMRPAVFVHATCLAFWIGSLIPLADILRRNHEQALDALARFSRVIPCVIVALVLSGTVLAFVQIETPNALVSTAYGRLLGAKLSLVAVLLLVAAWNRFLTPAVVAGREAARRHLVRSTFAEIVLVVMILGLVAAWRFTPPPRSIEIAASRPANLHIHSAEAMVDLTLTPGRAGLTRLSMLLLSGDFGGLDAKQLGVTFRNEPAGIEPIVRSASRDSSGYWIVDDFLIPVPGRWNVTIDILANDFEKITLDGTIDVRP